MQVPSCRSTQPGLEEEAEDLEKSLVLFLKHRLFSLSTCLLARSLRLWYRFPLYPCFSLRPPLSILRPSRSKLKYHLAWDIPLFYWTHPPLCMLSTMGVLLSAFHISPLAR